jgi:hypothetical protein
MTDETRPALYDNVEKMIEEFIANSEANCVLGATLGS